MNPAEEKAILERLCARQSFGIKLGLHVEEALLRRLGDPHRQFASLHVAGTNGKGSVCALIESVLRSAGYRTGLYTSPHLVRLNERIAVEGRPIPDADLVALARELEPHDEAVAREIGQTATFFEYTTAMAFEYFRRRNVQIAVIEVGMGGRLDATNVITPLVSVITRIALEHTRHLGKDVESIAREKGGIIKPGRPVVLGIMDEKPEAVLRALAEDRGSPVVRAAETVSIRVRDEDFTGTVVDVETARTSYGRCRLALVGRHQIENLASAVAALETLSSVAGWPLSEEVVRAGIASAQWPGRLQTIATDPLTLVDGAHNPDAAERLAASLRRLLKGRPLALVVGMCEDKDARQFLVAFRSIAQRLWLVPIRNPRNTPAPALLQAAREAGYDPGYDPSLPSALASAQAWARPQGGVVCVTGSLYLVGEVLEHIGASPGSLGFSSASRTG